MNKTLKQKNNQNGFTLIEVSIVMIIIGIALVGAIEVYKIYSEKQKIERMNLLMTDVNQYLSKFPTLIDPSLGTIDPATGLPDPDQTKPYGRMPCPAPLNGETAGNNYSTESCAGAKVVNVPGKGRVLIGKLPTATLGIRNDYMKDIFDNYLIYAVTEAATDAATYGRMPGAIEVTERGIERRIGNPQYGELVDLEKHENVQFIVLSVGETGEGAYAYNGSLKFACGTGRDKENCNEDHKFIYSDRSENSNNNEFYDDMMIFEAYTLTVPKTQESASCDQAEGAVLMGTTCPDGWEKAPEIEGFSNGTLPWRYGGFQVNSPGPTRYNGQGIKYYNETEDGEYFFSEVKLPTTTNLGGSGTVYCEKSNTNTKKQKCLSKSVSFSGPSYQTRQQGNCTSCSHIEQEALNALKCPDGYFMIDKSVGTSATETGESPNGNTGYQYNVTSGFSCAKK